MNLNLATYKNITYALGPGGRFALWVQGCPFKCKNCISPDWITFKEAIVISTTALAKVIINQKDIQGISISGGEPMMQASKIAELIGLVRTKRPELNILVFTGFLRQQLIWKEAKELLNSIDLLIDGQYVEHKNNGQGLRGSSNQSFHFLTDKLLPYQKELEEQRSKLELQISNEGALMTGIPKKDFKW